MAANDPIGEEDGTEDIADSSTHPWRRTIQHVLCRCCGYEPPKEAAVPAKCPKCYSGSWDRFVWRGKLRPPHASGPRNPSRPRPTPRPAVPVEPAPSAVTVS